MPTLFYPSTFTPGRDLVPTLDIAISDAEYFLDLPTAMVPTYMEVGLLVSSTSLDRHGQPATAVDVVSLFRVLAIVGHEGPFFSQKPSLAVRVKDYSADSPRLNKIVGDAAVQLAYQHPEWTYRTATIPGYGTWNGKRFRADAMTAFFRYAAGGGVV